MHGKGLDPRLEYAIEGLAQQGLIDASYDADLRLLSRILVVMRLVAPDSNEPPEKSRGLVASLCGHESWDVAACRARRGAAEDRGTAGNR